MFGRPCGRAESGREALRKGRKWSGGPVEWSTVFGGSQAGCKVVGGPSGRAGSGGAIRQVRKWSEGPVEWPKVVGGSPKGREVVEGPSGRARIGWGPSSRPRSGRGAIR